MVSSCRGKRKLHVDDDEDWEEDRKNEEDEDEEGEAFDWSKPILIEEGRDYVRARGKQHQWDDLIPSKDGGTAKLALEIQKKELEIMKQKLALTSRRHSARVNSSDEEEDRVGKKWEAMRRPSQHNSQMKAKRRAVNKACREQIEERYGRESQDSSWILTITVLACQIILNSISLRCCFRHIKF